MKYINNSHLKSHNLTPTEFKAMYPEVEAIPQEIRDANKRNSEKGKMGVKKYKSALYNNLLNNYNKDIKKCMHCEKTIPYEKRRNKFCSQSCAASLNNLNREIVYSEQAMISLKNSGLRNIDNFLNSPKRKKVIHYNKCKVCSKMYSCKKGIHGRKTCSERCLKVLRPLISNRKNNIKTKFGHYKGIYCASSWELAFLIYNLDLGKDIKRCNLTFSYIMNDEEKIYFPDFLIDNIIYEVKGRELEDVAFKTQAVIDAGYQIELIRKNEITPIIKFLKEKYGFKDITELYDQKV
jgi:predicted nucleic acid-binding Zn ribbon protein